MVLRPLRGLVICLAPVLAHAETSSPLHTHVLHDRVIDQHRELTLAFDRGGRCVLAREVVVDPPYSNVAPASCLAELVGPADATPVIHVEGEAVALTAPQRTVIPPRGTEASRPGITLELVPAGATVPIGHAVVAAYLRVSSNGKPASDVELNITSRGARPRALHWVGPGLAQIELVAPAWQASIEVAAQHAGDPPARLELAIDRGAPARVLVTMPAIHVGVPFTPHVRVITRDGVEVPAGEVRLELAGCEAETAGSFRCTRAGTSELQVALAADGGWIPIERQPIDAIALVAPPPTPTIDDRLGWQLGARAGRSTGQTWWGGLAAAGTFRVAPAMHALAGLAWQYQQPTFGARAPVTSELELAHHELELVAGGEIEVNAAVPWVLHLALGPAFVLQRARMGTGESTSMGLELVGTGGAGTRIALGTVAVAIDLDVRATQALVAPTWAMPAGELLLEVGLASR